MRVAIFTDTYRPQINGVTNTIDQMTAQFDRLGIEYRIFAPLYESESDEAAVERFYSLKFFLYPECRVALPNVFRIHTSLNEFKPDIIHLMTEFNMGLAGLKYAIRYKIPVISNYSTNFSQYTSYYKIELLKQGVSSYMLWFHSQCLLTTCPSVSAQSILHRYGIYRTAIFSRGIDTERFSPAHRSSHRPESTALEQKIHLLYVGRVAPEKDLALLRESYAEIERRYPSQTTLTIVGDGPMLEECQQTFPKSTRFTGFKKGRELARLYASSDLFICPSSTETFGNVVLEAMASGLAVIGSCEGGVGETIQHMKNGLHFSARSASSLTERIDLLMTMVDLRESLQRKGRQFALSRSWNQVVEKLIELYQETIQQNADFRISG
jgi:glycosyltransferase involved in cell wall biosynthesis